MALGRELSQLASLINISDVTKNIGVATATPYQNIGVGTLSPSSKVSVVGDVFISGVVTANTFYGDGANLTNISGSKWTTTSSGINTLSNVGIGTTNPTAKLSVGGDAIISGVVTANTFYGDGSNLTNISASKWTTTSSGIHTLSNVGIGTTSKSNYKLFVDGDTRITGILSIGQGTVTIDGNTNTVMFHKLYWRFFIAISNRRLRRFFWRNKY